MVVFEPRDESVKVMEVPAPQAQTQLRAKRCPRDVPPGRRCAPWFSRTSAEWWGQRSAVSGLRSGWTEPRSSPPVTWTARRRSSGEEEDTGLGGLGASCFKIGRDLSLSR